MSDAAIGSSEWIRHVRSTPPVRDPLGRSRPTHQFAPFSEFLGRKAGIEGGNELTAFLLIEILQTAGLVRWFKEQPLQLTTEVHGIEAVPDFIFEWMDGRVYVPEVKAKRYITADVLSAVKQLTGLFAEGGITYLLWNNKDHVDKTLWSNVRKVWNCRGALYAQSELDHARAAIRDGPQTIGALVKRGVDPDVIYHLVDRGHAHINLTQKRNEHLLVTEKANSEYYRRLLGSQHDPEGWWNALSGSGAT